MPLYDYRCAACGREVEVMHGINDRGPDACEACGSAMKKVLSPPAIHFKGSGWAKKDAATSTAKKATPKGSSSTGSDESAKGSSAKSETTGQGASDSKGEAKASTSSAATD